MPAQVGALDAMVLLVAILVGLALGALVAWASLLLRTGHPARPVAGEGTDEVPIAPRHAERARRRGPLLLLLAVGEAVLMVLILSVLSSQPWTGLGDEPVVPVLFSLMLLLLVLLSAVGEWRWPSP